MKFLIPILCLMLVACDEAPKQHVEKATRPATMIATGFCEGDELVYCIVTIDGNHYIATRSYSGGWSLCPK